MQCNFSRVKLIIYLIYPLQKSAKPAKRRPVQGLKHEVSVFYSNSDRNHIPAGLSLFQFHQGGHGKTYTSLPQDTWCQNGSICTGTLVRN